MADLEMKSWRIIQMQNGEDIIAFEVYNPSSKWLESFNINITADGSDPSSLPLHSRIRCEIAPHATAKVTYMLGVPSHGNATVARHGSLVDPIYH